MYFDMTDLDSGDEDVAWSPKQTINDNHDIHDDTSRLVHDFGDFVDNHGWIKCRSRSYPDRVYFHNTHSGCNTWYRPTSRYADIPFVSIQRVCHADDVSTTNDIELLSVSDNENESAAKRNSDKSSTVAPDVIARCYYTPQVDLISDDDSCRSPRDALDASECRYNEKEEINGNNNVDEDIGDERSDSETGCSTFCATNFLETEFFVGEDEINVEGIDRIFNPSLDDDEVSSATTLSHSEIAPYVVYGVPRLKRIRFEDQLIKPRRTRVSKPVDRGRRKIICDMYGVKTINYDLPTPDQVLAEVGVKSSTLSESDSDVSEPSPSSRDAKTTLSFESEWRDIEKNLHQPLLSDPSSSPSSRSDTNSSSTCWSTSSDACSTCSTCSSCTENMS